MLLDFRVFVGRQAYIQREILFLVAYWKLILLFGKL